MKKIALIMGMIIVLAFSMIILSACDSSDNTSNDVTNTAAGVTNTKEEAWNDYTFKELSFRLPSGYKETESGSEDTKIYSTDLVDNSMTLFSVASISAQGTDFIANASESLGDYEFNLSDYEIVSKSDPKINEFNGMKTISIDVKYNNSSTSSDGEVEYCYAQKGDTVYVLCYELFTQNGKELGDTDFSSSFDGIKNSLKFAE